MNRVITHLNLPEEVINDFHQFGKFSLHEKLLDPLSSEGVRFFHLDLGGDWVSRVLNTASENYFWNAMNGLDLILSELEHDDSNWISVRSWNDISHAQEKNQSAVILALGGGRPLEGKANLNLLSNLRHFYRSGVRVIQIAGHGRNRLADGVAEARTHGKLSYFGKDVVDEMTKMGMIIDTAAINNEGFCHITELTDMPLINSRTGASALSSHPLNLSDDRIKKLAATGGVMGLSFYADLIAVDKDEPGVEDLVRHIDHICSLVGAEYLAIGGDISSIDSPTPTRYERHPGLVNGIRFRERKNDYAKGLAGFGGINLIGEELDKRGYKEEEIVAILGGNMLRLYKEIL